MNKTEKNRAESQALAQFESIKKMVERANHIADGCTLERCSLSAQTIFEGINLWDPKRKKATEDELREYHDQEQAMRVIDEDPLSLQVRSGWTSLGGELKAEEFEILLCTGGPAVRIVGQLSEHQEPESARLEYQDWFTAWTEYRLDSEQEEILVDYCRHFYFGS